MYDDEPRPPRRAPATSTRQAAAAAPAAPTTMPVGAVYRPRRNRWPGYLAVGALCAGVAAVVVSNHYDDRSVGQRLDAGIAAAGQSVDQGVQGLRDGAQSIAQSGAAAGDNVAASWSDASITAAVKASLATDPALSAIAIDVDTQDGIVRLQGPAPDPVARERASVLARAPEGVRGVDNQLRVPGEAALPTTS